MVEAELPFLFFRFLQVFLSLGLALPKRDCTYVQNLIDMDKLQLVEETTYHMQRGVALLFMVEVGHGEVMVHGNPLIEKKHLKGLHILIAYKPNQLLKNLGGFQKDVDTHGTHVGLSSQITTLKVSLFEKDKTLKIVNT